MQHTLHLPLLSILSLLPLSALAQSGNGTFDYEEYPFAAIVSNAAELTEALQEARQSGAERYRIFLRNGEYDFGQTALTAVPQRTSLIGESQEGVIIYNTPSASVSKYQDETPVLFIDQNQNDVYMQDLTIRANRDWATKTSKGQALALRQRGKRAIYKCVTLQGVQDTYYINKADASAYFENCSIAGEVDFIYGDGTLWFERCTLQPVSSRAYITAPNTQPGYRGMVFNGCTIAAHPEAKDAVTGYRLGRPWGDSPASTFLHTTMNVLPTASGWGSMTSGLTLRFHEYGSMDADGNLLDLSQRSISGCSPAADSDAPVLTEEQAEAYTPESVFQKVAKNWDPTSFTTQFSAPTPTLSADGTLLSWDPVEGAYCYAVCRDGSVVAFTFDTTYELTDPSPASYSLRVANLCGGLGPASSPASGISTVRADQSPVAIPYDLMGRRINCRNSNGSNARSPFCVIR